MLRITSNYTLLEFKSTLNQTTLLSLIQTVWSLSKSIFIYNPTHTWNHIQHCTLMKWEQLPHILLMRFYVGKQVLYWARKCFTSMGTSFSFHLIRVSFSMTRHRKGQQRGRRESTCDRTLRWTAAQLTSEQVPHPGRRDGGQEGRAEDTLVTYLAEPPPVERSKHTHTHIHSRMNGNLVCFYKVLKFHM